MLVIQRSNALALSRGARALGWRGRDRRRLQRLLDGLLDSEFFQFVPTLALSPASECIRVRTRLLSTLSVAPELHAAFSATNYCERSVS